MTLSVVIVSWNTEALTLDCLESLQRTQSVPLDVIVVDNASTDGTVASIERRFPAVKIVELQENRGFGGGHNAGVAHATGELTLLLNSDTILIEDIGPLLAEFEDPRVGAVAPRLLNPDRTPQRSVRGRFPTAVSVLRENPYVERMLGPTTWGDHTRRREVAWAVGAAIVIRTSLLRELGGFDEAFFMYYEETDLCRRLAASGHTVVFNPVVSVIHVRGGSLEAGDHESLAPVQYFRSQLLYLRKHRVPGRSVVRAVILLGSLVLWMTMRVRRRGRLAERYRLIAKSCLAL